MTVEELRAELERELAGRERAEMTLASGLTHGGADPILVHVRKRGHRYDLDDGGAAVDRAGRPSGWLPIAKAVVDENGMNVNRAGIVFVPAVEGRDLARLALSVASASRAVYAELLEHGESVRA